MKAKIISAIIAINWACSFVGLAVVSPFWATLIGAGWFFGSCILLAWAQNKSWFVKGMKNELFDFLMKD